MVPVLPPGPEGMWRQGGWGRQIILAPLGRGYGAFSPEVTWAELERWGRGTLL